MEYANQKAIYLQIADKICEKVLSREWKPEERIPSVRELALSFEVNPNTAMRTYAHLQQTGIIHNRRGIGYFLAADAFQKTQELLREQFLTTRLPEFMKTLNLLGYTIDDLKKLSK